MKLITNIAGTIALGILTTFLLVYLSCQDNTSTYCRSDSKYYYASAVVTTCVLAIYFRSQFIKTHRILFPMRQQPLRADGLATVISSVTSAIGSLAADEVELAEEGWIVYFADGSQPIMVTKRQFYYWLIKVIEVQNKLEQENKLKVQSPLSFRVNASLGRKTLKAYRLLLDEAKATQRVSNSTILKETDPLNIIKAVETIRRTIRL